ncbi:MAG: type II toxin-antitoxin system VapC family toxin [Crocosphaera sp.]|nr:type II toxin-antitoxin system VapC family toxin [Crocosphaera sp.]
MSIKYLLDINVISEVTKKIPLQSIFEKMEIHKQEVATASLVIHELLYGCLRLPTESKKRALLENYITKIPQKMPILGYDLKSAQYHGKERARLSKIGKTPAFVDGQIASIAVTNDLILVTNNVNDFQDFNGLLIENWFV